MPSMASTPFIVLESSSGMGKTQVAFNLQATEIFDVSYIECVKPREKEESFGLAYSSRSQAFFTCLNKDFKSFASDTEAIGEIISLKRTQTLFFMVSFLLHYAMRIQ